jgi:hypothetical protein
VHHTGRHRWREGPLDPRRRRGPQRPRFLIREVFQVQMALRGNGKYQRHISDHWECYGIVPVLSVGNGTGGDDTEISSAVAVLAALDADQSLRGALCTWV